MAGGGLDDELLALAGGSARQIDLSSDDDGDRVRTGSKRDAKPSASSSLAKKRRLDLLDESASGSDADAPGSDDDAASSDEAASNPYPYQGIYKSARDMEELMSMNELDREDILTRRRDEINKRRQKYELAAMVKAQKAAAGATKKSASKKRVVRGGRARKGESDLSESDDDEEDDDDADGDSDYGYGGGAASAAKSRKKKLPGQTDAKSAKLVELRKKRKEKAAGGAVSRGADSDVDAAPSKPRRRHPSSSASDVSYSDYSDDEQDYRRTSRGSKLDASRGDTTSSSAPDPPTLADLNAARLTRDLIESRLYAPRWRDTLAGGFIRFSWGTRPRSDGRGSETVYRIHQVTEVIEKPGKFYDLSDDGSNKWCNVYLAFEHNGHEQEAKLNMLSRGDFTESERERWLAFLTQGQGQRVPKKAAVARKADELEKFFTSPLTESDIGKILETKKRIRQEAQTVIGDRAGFDSPRTNATPGVSTPTTAPSAAGGASVAPQSLEARLAAVNERNRALDRSKMSDVERKARNNKLAAAAAVAAAAKAEQDRKANEQSEEGAGVELTNAKPGTSGMGNGFVAVKNYSTLVEVDLGDF